MSDITLESFEQEWAGVIDTIKGMDYQLVSLQFTEDMLHLGTAATARLQKLLKQNQVACKVVLMGDTGYNSMSPDALQAAHIETACLIHFGRSSLTPCTDMPVYHVFGRVHVSVGHVISSIVQAIRDTRRQAWGAAHAGEASTGEADVVFYHPGHVVVLLDQTLSWTRSSLRDGVRGQLLGSQDKYDVACANRISFSEPPALHVPSTSAQAQGKCSTQCGVQVARDSTQACCSTGVSEAMGGLSVQSAREGGGCCARGDGDGNISNVRGCQSGASTIEGGRVSSGVVREGEGEGQREGQGQGDGGGEGVGRVRSSSATEGASGAAATNKNQGAGQQVAGVLRGDQCGGGATCGDWGQRGSDVTIDGEHGQGVHSGEGGVVVTCGGLTWTIPRAVQCDEKLIMIWVGCGVCVNARVVGVCYQNATWACVEADGKLQLAPPPLVPSLAKRRRHVITKSRQATIIGLLLAASTPPLQTITTLKRAAKIFGKKTYTFGMGRPHPAKLANFPEVEAWVMVCDGEGFEWDEGREYMAPILTPFEGLAVIMGKEVYELSPLFDGTYPLGTPCFYTYADQIDQLLAQCEQCDDTSTAVIALEQQLIATEGGQLAPVSNAVDYFQHRRTYKGLSADYVKHDVASHEYQSSLQVVEGDSGRAAGYQKESGGG